MRRCTASQAQGMIHAPPKERPHSAKTPAALTTIPSKHQYNAQPAAPQAGDGRNTMRRYLIAALRATRRASKLNLQHGPWREVASALHEAREALDSASWLCGYADAESES